MPLADHELVPQGEEEIDHLGPGAEVRYLLGITMGGPRSIRVRLEWEDQSEQPGLWTSQLKL